MSKRDLKKYLSELSKTQLEEQFIEMYDKFVNVKVYYNFVFNPNEKNLIKDARLKISNEYFPINGKKPKMRRSVAQKFIKHFISLGMDPFLIADLMCFNIEIAQTLSSERSNNSDTFFKSVFTSYQQLVKFLIEKSVVPDFKNRVEAIKNNTVAQKWFNNSQFEEVFEKLFF